MPWVRFDDQYPIHRKVAALSDAAYRLHSASIPWSNRNLMDGWIPAEDLDQVCAQVRKSATFVLELVRRGLFHEAGFVCDSDACPADGSQTDGWVIHDYWDYQPSKKKVKAERAKNAERQRRHRERNGVSNGVTNDDVTPPRPDPSRTEEAKASSSSAKQTKREKKPEPYREDVNALCTRLADHIEANSGERPEITEEWKRQARLLLDKDKRPIDKALALIDWCQKSTFWQTNILSMPKFRDQYTQLRMKANAEWKHEREQGTPQGPRSSAPDLIPDSEKCEHRKRASTCGLCRAEKLGGSHG